MPARLRSNHIFVNCPFDDGYRPIFNAIVFAVRDLGLVARCALEEDDGGEVRLVKIQRIIEECRYGIHDISAVELDAATHLPRFNMPLELGLFLGCRRFGAANQRKKTSLILDRDKYRYRAFISDIAGQDIHSHDGKPEQAIMEIRNWLRSTSGQTTLPGAAEIIDHYRQFQRELPALSLGLGPGNLTFLDLSTTIGDWLRESR